MGFLRITARALSFFFLITASSPEPVLARNRRDLCGISMHASDFPDLGNFSTIAATLAVPQIFSRPGDARDPYPELIHGIALCCGDDCSTRLSVYLATFSSGASNFTSRPYFHLYPYFFPLHLPAESREAQHLNASDTVRFELEILSPTRAQIVYAKYQGPAANLTVRANIRVGYGAKGEPTLNATGTIDGKPGEHTVYGLGVNQGKNTAPPTLCGDSAWWFAADTYGLEPGSPKAPNDKPTRFTPLLFGQHGLKTTTNRWFPTDFPLGGAARVWDMVNDYGRGEEVMCKVRGFVETGMTMMHSPHGWGI